MEKKETETDWGGETESQFWESRRASERERQRMGWLVIEEGKGKIARGEQLELNQQTPAGPRPLAIVSLRQFSDDTCEIIPSTLEERRNSMSRVS